jgi:23S rRNA A2030 N6-methylase RlmJ
MQIEQPHERARLTALAEQMADEQRRRILAGWAENKAILRDRERRQMDCVRPKYEETDND